MKDTKRGDRRAKTESHISQQTRIAKSAGLSGSGGHKYAKRKALDCGQADCKLCRNPRRDGQLTIQELRHLQDDE